MATPASATAAAFSSGAAAAANPQQGSRTPERLHEHIVDMSLDLIDLNDSRNILDDIEAAEAALAPADEDAHAEQEEMKPDEDREEKEDAATDSDA